MWDSSMRTPAAPTPELGSYIQPEVNKPAPNRLLTDFTESLNRSGWKRALRSPTHPTMPTDHISQCHIPTVLEHVQGW